MYLRKIYNIWKKLKLNSRYILNHEMTFLPLMNLIKKVLILIQMKLNQIKLSQDITILLISWMKIRKRLLQRQKNLEKLNTKQECTDGLN